MNGALTLSKADRAKLTAHRGETFLWDVKRRVVISRDHAVELEVVCSSRANARAVCAPFNVRVM